jgi:hypothetical protein
MAWSNSIQEETQRLEVESRLKIPYWLRPLHGYSATLGELLLVYLTAVAFASLVLISIQDRLEGLSALQIAILVLVSLDLAGGAVANLCQGTRTYWRSRNISLRILFLAVHAIHGIGIAYVFPEAVEAVAVAYIWMVVAGSVLILTRNTSVPLALALVVMGAAAIHLPQGLESATSLLLTVFLIKLVFSFSGGPNEQGQRAY